MTRRRPLSWIAIVAMAAVAGVGRVDAARAQDALAAAIDTLGAFDFSTRVTSSRTVRRAPAAEAVPALTAAVKNHKDSYVRYRALVLLAGFDDRATSDVMTSVMSDRNDRLRAVAFEWFERHPASAPVQAMIEALPRESSEFVRPALTRALAALHADPRARAAVAPLIDRGEDFFRGEVISALGDYKATWAAPAIEAVAELEGPLQEDAVLALGKIGALSSVSAIGGLQPQVPRERQIATAAALCMMGASNSDRLKIFLEDTLKFGASNDGFQRLLRSAAHSIGAMAARGDQGAFKSLIDVALGAGEQARAPIALALGSAAVEQPAATMTALAARTSDQAAAIELLRDAFDRLEEDFAEEMFYVAVRKSYWAAAEGSPARRLAEAVLQKLEF